MSVGKVSGPRPGGDSNDGEDGSVYLWGLARARNDRMLAAHIGDRNREVKPFRVREGAPTTRMLMLFTPVFPPGCGVGSRRLVKNESCCTETDEGENGEEPENPADEDIYTTKGLRVVTNLGEESVAVYYGIWIRRLFLLLDRVLSETCPCLFDECASRDVVSYDGKERYCCEE